MKPVVLKPAIIRNNGSEKKLIIKPIIKGAIKGAIGGAVVAAISRAEIEEKFGPTGVEVGAAIVGLIGLIFGEDKK